MSRSEGIRAIFYAEFDNIVGPKILYQAPDNYVSADDFDDISEYMITKPDLCGKVLTVIHPSLTPSTNSSPSGESALALPSSSSASATGAISSALAQPFVGGLSSPLGGVSNSSAPLVSRSASDLHHQRRHQRRSGGGAAPSPARVVTFPVGLRHEKYGRNALLFSVGFVLGVDADSRPYEPVLRRLGMALYSMEAEAELLHRPERKAALKGILVSILHGLNLRGECFVHVDSCDTIALKLFAAQPEPPAIRDSDVPVRLRDLDMLAGPDADLCGWDLCLRLILPLIDGRNYVRAIAEAANVEVSLVRRALQQLSYYGAVALVDIFQYSNIYATQPRVQLLLRSQELRAACIRYVVSSSSASASSLGGKGRDGEDWSDLTISPAAARPAEGPETPSAGGNATSIATSYSSGGEMLSAATAALGGGEALLPPPPPAPLQFDRVFRLYCAFGAGSRTCDICAQGDTEGIGIDDRRFITFGIVHGILRRMHKYPVRVTGRGGGSRGPGSVGGTGTSIGTGSGSGSGSGASLPGPSGAIPLPPHTPTEERPWPSSAALVRLLDGEHSLEDICCRFCASQQAVEAAIEEMDSFVFVLK
jgi:hypothetical protein